jgi:regulator of sigma E protease
MTAERLLVYLLTLSVLVVLHEYGHFLVARRNGVRVTDFALGFGPTILKWTSPRSGTVYRWNVFPIGGYCQMKGEDGKSSEAEQQREFRQGGAIDADNFQAKRPLQRLAIVVAGPIANFIVALVLFFSVGFVFGVPSEHPTLLIGQLVKGAAADRAGLRPGDKIVAVDGVTMASGDQLVALIHGSAGKTLRLRYERNGATHEVTVVPKLSRSPDGSMEGHIGYAPVLPLEDRWNAVASAQLAWSHFSGTVTATFGALGGLVTHPSSVAGQFQGPIGIARTSMAVQALGIGPFLSLAALISISLGILNLLPIPALDGGRAVFILVEMLRGRPVDPEKEALVHVGGFAFLIVLMIAVSFHDVSAAIAGHSAF